ncbi:hypothetical protein [Sporichthya polymorpha]|uniref:hypothetical protein n=1 Tax=Sporichthya polymorpha TaxID=35751 RepID=UPI00037C31B2|nr:hypothetical protein [Sporichthya polymorpha]
MAGAPTAVQQQTTVGEGLAVGCLAIGVTSVTARKLTLELAFSRAWRDWHPAREFLAICTTLARNDIVTILSRSERRRGPVWAAWTLDRGLYVPYLTQDWTVEETADELESSCGVGREDWKDLAGSFVHALQAG